MGKKIKKDSLLAILISFGTLKGIRTPAARMKTWCPRPLDDEGIYLLTAINIIA